jgi:hypothetical protein
MTKRLLFVLALWVPLAAAQSGPIASHRKAATFDAVKEDIVLAIQAKGFVIDHTSFIGNMLERTAKDVGATKRVFLKAEALQFCSAVVSRRTMEQDPRNIAYCPYVISLYVTPEEPKTVRVVYQRRLPEIDRLLEDILREALQ